MMKSIGNFFHAIGTGFSHGFTTSMGVIATLCGVGSIIGLVPTPYTAIVAGVCAAANGLGHIFAADATQVVTTSPPPAKT